MVRKAAKKEDDEVVGLAIAVSRFGHDPIPVTVAEGATVQDVLTKAKIDLSGTEKVFVAGAEVDLQDEVEDKDVISVVTPKQAGSK
jgi:putative ubiquitin-RnfH superfamily antitoxin RatB of RatAB toxin-antitoxin module